MKCKHVQQKMLDYSEKLLDERVRSRIEKHLQKCSTCTQELSDIEKTLNLLQSVPLPEPPESFWTDFTSSVMSKINKMEAPSISITRRLFYLPRFKMAMALLVLIGIIGGVYFYFKAEIQQRLHPVNITAELPGQKDNTPTSPINLDTENAIETALSKIASEDLTQDMLESDLALFNGTNAVTIDIDYSDDMLYFLINSLTEEEKKALLSELYKMRDASR